MNRGAQDQTIALGVFPAASAGQTAKTCQVGATDRGPVDGFGISRGKQELLVITRIIAASIWLAAGLGLAQARDDGRYANSPLKPWFESLQSKHGIHCCADADGMALADVDWDVKDGHYRVRLDGEWIVVPDDTVITEPNRAGRTMVWPRYLNGKPIIRCFMPGTMT